MSRHRDRDDAGRDGTRRRTLQQVRCIGCRRAVLAMDPYARAELPCVLPCVCDVVLMREEDVRDAARALEPLHELRGIARRIDEQVAALAPSEVRVRAERRPGVEPTAPHAVSHLLRKDAGLRRWFLRFAAYGCGGTHEDGAPARKPLLLCVRLPCEDAFAV